MPPASSLAAARAHAQAGRFEAMLQICDGLVQAHDDDAAVLLDVGALVSAFGFLSRARRCYERARELMPNDLRPLVNIANVSREAADHALSSRLYAELLRLRPDHPIIRRNALTSLEYDPSASDAQRLAQARAWGAWATQLAGGPRPRPPLAALEGRPLRIGYVSADICHHTVGLFVKDVIQAHDRRRAQPFVYSAGNVQDWVSHAVRAASTWRDVSHLDDGALAAQVRADAIDVLVDLSGHTGGSRLTAFAYRPAPVQVAWLGYFATTGLDCMDAVLLDEWHAPPGTEAQFVETVVRLPRGRFSYQPVPFAPEVAPAPLLRQDAITFGCFNNTAKLNAGVFDLWARVLAAVPASRLVLKWRTFNDEPLREQVLRAFAERGIDPDRLELRGPSFHADALREYADIDIALDPFPFTGGLTSCEALWMGVPVVTWPQGRVVSRQTHAFLAQIGLPELSARDADDYVHIATALAHDRARLLGLRASLRDRMRQSPLMDVPAFVRDFEHSLIDLCRRIGAEVATVSP